MSFKEKLSELTSTLITTNGDQNYIRACIKVAYIQAADAWIKSASEKDIKGRRAKTMSVINTLNRSPFLANLAEETVLFSQKALREDLAWFNTAERIAEQFYQDDIIINEMLKEIFEDPIS
jgi:hypothetical protein